MKIYEDQAAPFELGSVHGSMVCVLMAFRKVALVMSSLVLVVIFGEHTGFIGVGKEHVQNMV